MSTGPTENIITTSDLQWTSSSPSTASTNSYWYTIGDTISPSIIYYDYTNSHEERIKKLEEEIDLLIQALRSSAYNLDLNHLIWEKAMNLCDMKGKKDEKPKCKHPDFLSDKEIML